MPERGYGGAPMRGPQSPISLRLGVQAGLVLFSALFLGDEITATQAVGYAICLFFFGLYNYYKMNKM